MTKPNPRVLEVKGIKDITPNMRRITLGGAGMQDFPIEQESAYIKLMFAGEAGKKPIMRTYTIIQQRDDEIDVDFVLHGLNYKGAEGPASHWAKTTQIGDTILIGGGRPQKAYQSRGGLVFIGGRHDRAARHHGKLSTAARGCRGLCRHRGAE